MDRGQRFVRRHRWLVLLLLLLMALPLVYFLLAGDSASPDIQAPEVQLAGEPQEAVSGPPDTKAVPPQYEDRAEAADTTAVPPPEPTKDEPPSDLVGDYTLTLRAIDGTGEPVPNAAFEFLVLTLSDYMRMRTGRLEGERPFTPARFDADGLWSIPSDRGNRVCVRPSGEGWSAVTPGERPSRVFAEDSGVVVVHHTSHGDHEAAITLLRRLTCVVHIEYADGEPYEGVFRYTELSDDAARELIGQHTVTYREGVTISVREHTLVRIGVTNTPRGGFAASEGVDVRLPQLERGRIEIIIPFNAMRQEQSGFILDHSGFRPGQRMLARFSRQSGSQIGDTIELSGPGETKTGNINPGWVRLVAVGDGLVWTTDGIVLKPGEWRRVLVAPVVPARFELTVQDEAGNPLDAVVSVKEVGHVNWGSSSLLALGSYSREGVPSSRSDLSIQVLSMNRARADASGLVAFSGTWSGSRTFLVEARGYETERIQAELHPGLLTVYGVVTLRRASASVTVQLIGLRDEDATDFRVMLHVPFGGSMPDRPVEFEEGAAVIRNVPPNRYQVMVTPRGGGQGWSKWIEVQPDTHYEVQIDVSKDYGIQED